MNSTRKKLATDNVMSQPMARGSESKRPYGSAIVQRKSSASANAKQPPSQRNLRTSGSQAVNTPGPKTIAPPVYRPKPTAQMAPARNSIAQRAQGIQAHRPPSAQPVARTVQRMASHTAARKLPVAPPAYRPQPVPRILQRKTAVAAPAKTANAPRPVPGSRSNTRTIQRAEMTPIKGLPGFFEGSLPEENRGGTFNTVWSQTEPAEEGSATMSHSSVKFSKAAKGHLVDFAEMDHLADEENTHAEDRLFAYAHQLAIEVGSSTGTVPALIQLPDFFVSASPCSSTFNTSGKSVGCTENLINWATNGFTIKSEMGCSYTVKVKIGTLKVNKLYKSSSYAGANGSMAALYLLKSSGAIGGWIIEKDPPLNTEEILKYKRVG